ncbi:efflux RND transporter periplasmic adaptor subunit [Flammeovirga agarivorans]|uniref:Efflux RND transporter periplasmic adaptor subunit n=1 Tax=Flammeovirga agarivorans TaxID=2726742 RepID=A0A7X8SKK6_9BACT|nr:efflux RND transporter periplasmic adaptor subunit [Flammeovirga agarivorans]NLR91872.1 efflux RND transporter periplasmic adaptor subunit [Flammeovirga agarivorans]
MKKILSLILMGAVFTSCYKKPDLYQAPKVPTVKVSHPHKEEIELYDTYTGYTEALGKVTIVPRVTGTLERRYFEPGEKVRKGQVLFTLEKEPYLSQLNQAKAKVERAKADLEMKKVTYQSYAKLVNTSAVSELKYLQSKANVDEAEAGLLNAIADLEAQKNTYSYTKIKAPISGTISNYYVDNGNVVKAESSTELAYIVNSSKMNIFFTVPATKYYELQKLHESLDGMSVDVLADDNETLLAEGKVIYHDPNVDLKSGSITLKAQVENKDAVLIDGTYVRIKLIKREHENAMLIPQVAIERDQVGPYVYTVESDTVRQHRVKLGEEIGDQIIVKSGVKESDDLIVSGIQRARDGIKVNPVTASK